MRGHRPGGGARGAPLGRGAAEGARGPNHERWLITYADLITLLLVFFVVMYSISKADEGKFAKLNASLQRAFNVVVFEGYDPTALSGRPGGASGNSVIDDFIAIRNDLGQLTAALGGLPGTGIDVRLNREGIVITISGALLFPSGRADLRPESLAVLDRIAHHLRRLPNEVRISGHTDNIPPNSSLYPTNWELSTARAIAVARYLSVRWGIAPARLAAVGYGEFRPVADNSTREGRMQNRRVEIQVVYPEMANLFNDPELRELR